jgi:hypothetical protein
MMPFPPFRWLGLRVAGAAAALMIAVSVVGLPAHIANSAAAQDFGEFEVIDKLPKIGDVTISKNISEFVKNAPDKSPIVTVANIIFQIGLALLVMISLLMVVIGGYIYMTAGGDSKKISSAKLYIGSALTGIALGLTGYLILNTISTQFTEPTEPTLILPTPKK